MPAYFSNGKQYFFTNFYPISYLVIFPWTIHLKPAGQKLVAIKSFYSLISLSISWHCLIPSSICCFWKPKDPLSRLITLPWNHLHLEREALRPKGRKGLLQVTKYRIFRCNFSLGLQVRYSSSLINISVTVPTRFLGFISLELNLTPLPKSIIFKTLSFGLYIIFSGFKSLRYFTITYAWSYWHACI